jgi:hypothetical protein
MRTKLGFIPVGIVVALAVLATGAHATGGGKIAAACSNQTVAVFGKPTRLRFVLYGKVSCKEAHRTIRTYFRKAAAGPCNGNICPFDLPGGWSCALPGAASEAPLMAGCFRGRASVKVYKARRAEAVVFSPLAYVISCHMTDDGSFGGSWVYCWIGGNSHPTRHVKLDLHGQFSVAATTPIPLGLGGPSLAYGRRVRVGRFRCQSLRSGMKCTVTRTGKGFLINSTSVNRVG